MGGRPFFAFQPLQRLPGALGRARAYPAGHRAATARHQPWHFSTLFDLFDNDTLALRCRLPAGSKGVMGTPFVWA